LAHQFLAKPCDIGSLREAINRVYDLFLRLGSYEIKGVLGSLGALPSLPGNYYELKEKLSARRVNREEIISLMQSDVGMLSKLLQIVNSPTLGSSKPILTVREAVFFVDLQMLQEFLLVGEVFEVCEDHHEDNLFVSSFYRHSLFVGSLASSLMHPPEQVGEAFSAGMLHDVGRMILAARLPKLSQEIKQRATQQQIPFYQAEERSTSHALIGASLFSLWGLPYTLIEAVARHHDVEQVQHREFGILDAVYVAQILVEQVEKNSQDLTEMEDRYLRRMGVSDRLPRWREIAKTRGESISQGSSVAV
jgi:putative nucleotidyltransferase with HDIG domain